MTREKLLRNYWRYYKMLEEKVIRTGNYVEIHPDNFASFSNEYALLLQSIGAELDNFFKVYCGFDPDATKNITEYSQSILKTYPEIKTQKIRIINTDIVLQPFKDWDVKKPKQSLEWWEAFDIIKHNRTGNFSEAKQKNVLNILGALYLLEMKQFKNVAIEGKDGHIEEADSPGDKSKLFSLVDWELRYQPIGDFLALIDGSLYSITED